MSNTLTTRWSLSDDLSTIHNPNIVCIKNSTTNRSFGDGIAIRSVGLYPGRMNNYSTSSISQTGGYILRDDRVTFWETDIIGAEIQKHSLLPHM
ncbi:1231_t:CDS:2, partial [Gigaspora rosea]